MLEYSILELYLLHVCYLLYLLYPTSNCHVLTVLSTATAQHFPSMPYAGTRPCATLGRSLHRAVPIHFPDVPAFRPRHSGGFWWPSCISFLPLDLHLDLDMADGWWCIGSPAS